MVEIFAEVRKWLTLGILFAILGAVSGYTDRMLKAEAVWLQLALQKESRAEMIFNYNYPPTEEEFTDGRERHGGFGHSPDDSGRNEREGIDPVQDYSTLRQGLDLRVYEAGGCQGESYDLLVRSCASAD